MFYITNVDNDATAKRNEGSHQFFYLTRGVTDQLAMTLDCRHLIPVFILIFRLLKFTVERTISCHSSAVSFSESDERLTDLDNSRPAAYRAASFARCSSICSTTLSRIGIATKAPCEPVPAALGNPLAVNDNIELTSLTKQSDSFNVEALLDEDHETRDPWPCCSVTSGSERSRSSFCSPIYFV